MEDIYPKILCNFDNGKIRYVEKCNNCESSNINNSSIFFNHKWGYVFIFIENIFLLLKKKFGISSKDYDFSFIIDKNINNNNNNNNESNINNNRLYDMAFSKIFNNDTECLLPSLFIELIGKNFNSLKNFNKNENNTNHEFFNWEYICDLFFDDLKNKNFNEFISNQIILSYFGKFDFESKEQPIINKEYLENIVKNNKIQLFQTFFKDKFYKTYFISFKEIKNKDTFKYNDENVRIYSSNNIDFFYYNDDDDDNNNNNNNNIFHNDFIINNNLFEKFKIDYNNYIVKNEDIDNIYNYKTFLEKENKKLFNMYFGEKKDNKFQINNEYLNFVFIKFPKNPYENIPLIGNGFLDFIGENKFNVYFNVLLDNKKYIEINYNETNKKIYPFFENDDKKEISNNIEEMIKIYDNDNYVYISDERNTDTSWVMANIKLKSISLKAIKKDIFLVDIYQNNNGVFTIYSIKKNEANIIDTKSEGIFIANYNEKLLEILKKNR